ncbi:unnamed protein product [Schistocephalus solidus]|uniref:DUF4549 domain-containing protein n=1 Tax=Schistocephalus solidus TaxID=70667 RepID=A0A183SIX7_SCHSO|nr:unnamed protein product [Schistocephalus solidus]
MQAYYKKCGKLQDELSSMRKMDNELKDELKKLVETAPCLPPQPDIMQTYIQGRFDEEYCYCLDNSIRSSETEKEILGAFFDNFHFELYDINQLKDALEGLLAAPRQKTPPDNKVLKEEEGEDSSFDHPLSRALSPSDWPGRTRHLRRTEDLAEIFHERISHLPWFIQSRMARAFRGMLTNQGSKMNPNDYLRFLVDRLDWPKQNYKSLQARMERVWDRLLLSEAERTSQCIRYCLRADSSLVSLQTGVLTPCVVELWEHAAELVTQREEVMGKLAALEFAILHPQYVQLPQDSIEMFFDSQHLNPFDEKEGIIHTSRLAI